MTLMLFFLQINRRCLWVQCFGQSAVFQAR